MVPYRVEFQIVKQAYVAIVELKPRATYAHVTQHLWCSNMFLHIYVYVSPSQTSNLEPKRLGGELILGAINLDLCHVGFDFQLIQRAVEITSTGCLRLLFSKELASSKCNEDPLIDYLVMRQ